MATPDLLVEHFERKGVYKYIYPMAAWIPDSECRRAVGVAFTLHCWSLMALDDVIDGDTDFDVPDLLAASSELMHCALKKLAHVQVAPEFIEALHQLQIVWRVVKREPATAITTLDSWAETARIKCGKILAFYGSISAAIAGNKDENIVRACLEPLGIVFTLMDDFRDSEKETEQHSNLAVMIRNGLVKKSEVRTLFEDSVADFMSNLAAAPPALDFGARFTVEFEKCRRAIVDPELRILDSQDG